MATRHGGERRGNAADRRRRKIRFLREYGDGEICPCVYCGIVLNYETVEADRIIPGGSYRWDNVQPSCRACNLDRSNDESWTVEAAIAVGRIEVTAEITIRHKEKRA